MREIIAIRSTHSFARVLMAIAVVVPGPYLHAQQPVVRTLGKPEVESRESFTTISGVRELSDGRVIVSDSREKSLQVVDLVRGTSAPVGRAGAGPGEWNTPTSLYALGRDTTIMPDFANARYFTVNPDAKPGASFRLPDEGALMNAGLIGADMNGRLIFVAPRRAANPADGSSGAADVLRYTRSTGRIDSLAVLAQPKGEHSGASMIGGGMIRMFTNLPFASQDIAAAAPDGRVAIVRANPYHVEWIGADLRHTQGPTAPSSAIRLTSAEKDAYERAQTRPGSFTVRGPGGATPPSNAKSGGGAVAMNRSDMEARTNPDQTWPTVKPPFLANAARVASDGRVWVLRTRAHDDPIPSFDVFDATGRLVERVSIPPQTRLVAFGARSIYLARTDADDLVWLQRYALK